MKTSNGWALFHVMPVVALCSAAGLWIAANEIGEPRGESSALGAANVSVGNKRPQFRFTEDDIAPMVATMANAGFSNFVVYIDPNSGTQTVVTEIDHKPHLDIKPGSCPNPVNVMNGAAMALAVVPMGLLGNAFDVTQVDIGTIRLSPVQLTAGTTVELSPVLISYADIGSPFDSEQCQCAALGPDGILDIAIHFDRQQMIDGFGLQALQNNTEFPLRVTGLLTEGRGIFGTRDCIRILNQ
jgi:hypothetical protein